MRKTLYAIAALALLGCATAPPEEGAAGRPETPASPADGASQANGPEATSGASGVPEMPLTPAQRAALGVESVRITPEKLELEVGERRAVEVVALDPEGRPVPEVQLRKYVRSDALLYDPATDEVEALEPGEGTLNAIVVKPAPEGERPELVRGSAEIRVKPLSVTRVEVETPGEPLYAGMRYPIRARAHSALREREDVRAEWRSSDPDVARVSDTGFLLTGRPGTATLTARVEGVEASATVRVSASPVRGLTVAPEAVRLRTGDVARFTAMVRGRGGGTVEGVPVHWTASGVSGQPVEAAFIDGDGTFVASMPGTYLVTATVGSRAATAEVAVEPRDVRRKVEKVAHGAPVGHSTSDLWVFEGSDGRDYAYTGTHAAGAGGNVMYAWDVTDPSDPVITDSVLVDARVVNDVKVNADASLAVITREGASDRKNGIVILDLADPAHPRILSEYTETVTGGVHNTWIEGDIVYAIHDGTLAMHIIDISDPRSPREVGRWELEKPNKYLHDVTVKDGLAYLAYWDDGLIILDVGAGIEGGTPTDPKLVSRIETRTVEGGEVFGNTHHAVRYEDYVFLGDEIFGCEECVNGPRGYVHVIDVSDIRNPREVAWYRVPEAGTHNLWAEDGKLYVAYYQGGLRVVDITGELRGDLYRQGREIGWHMTEDGEGINPHQTMTWGPQPYEGLIYASDLNSGLWVLRLAEPERELVP